MRSSTLQGNGNLPRRSNCDRIVFKSFIVSESYQKKGIDPFTRNLVAKGDRHMMIALHKAAPSETWYRVLSSLTSVLEFQKMLEAYRHIYKKSALMFRPGEQTEEGIIKSD